MYIKYKEYDLLELFESKPISITGSIEDGQLIYSYENNQNFKVILILDLYKQTSAVGVTYNDSVVFSGEFNNVTSIKKSCEDLIINVHEKETIKIKFHQQIGEKLIYKSKHNH